MNRRFLVEAGVALALVGSACGGEGDPAHTATTLPPVEVQVDCEADNGMVREPTDPELDVAGVAATLGVSEERVAHGSYGEVTCTEAVTTDEILEGAVVSVRDFGGACAVLGTVHAVPLPGGEYTHLDVLCPELES